MISEPCEHMPAAESRLESRRYSDGNRRKDLAGKNNNGKSSQMLRGQVGTSFKLKVQRPGTGNRWISTYVRSIQLPFIPYYTVLDNTSVISTLSTFRKSFQGV